MGDGTIYCEGLIINFRNSRACERNWIAALGYITARLPVKTRSPYILSAAQTDAGGRREEGAAVFPTRTLATVQNGFDYIRVHVAYTCFLHLRCQERWGPIENRLIISDIRSRFVRPRVFLNKSALKPTTTKNTQTQTFACFCVSCNFDSLSCHRHTFASRA